MPTIPAAHPIQPTVRAEEMPSTFPRNRVCTRPGCKTVLSRFNAGPACQPCLHDARADRLLGSFSLQDLMEEI